MKTFEKGMKVRVVDDYGFHTSLAKATGEIIDVSGPLLVKVDGFTSGHGLEHDEWCFTPDELELAVQPSFMDDLKLKPQTKSVLQHLRKRREITTAKAERVYGITRLAAAIYDLRRAGYKITSEFKRDDVGHKYTKYVLAAA